ncbi:MAG TPA: hypothetical protein VK163_10720 [Opitutaceae bacterium]|nr:hypothetical protein [Opitutaceae bacterium]
MKLIAVLAASSIGVAAFAQSSVSTETTAPVATAGLLGSRYIAAGFGWTDINHSGVDAMSTGLTLNVPVTANVDVSLGYAYSWAEGAIDLGHAAGATVTGYVVRGNLKPFASASLGYDWSPNSIDKDHGIWGADAGVEYALSDSFAVNASTGYTDDFGQHRDSQWDATVGASYNFTSKLVGTASVSYIEGGSFGYAAGIAFRF